MDRNTVAKLARAMRIAHKGKQTVIRKDRTDVRKLARKLAARRRAEEARLCNWLGAVDQEVPNGEQPKVG